MKTHSLGIALAMVMSMAGSGVAQDTVGTSTGCPQQSIQHLRPNDRCGINVFETPKDDSVPFEGFKLGFGASFSQSIQDLRHQNTAAPKIASGVDANQLINMGYGFDLAAANFTLNAQLADGIRVALTSYLSARHHNETWVKDGYLLVDKLPMDVPVLQGMMKYVTIKAGHFEINYGDAHLRRSDNGNAIFNPFIGNYILDAFTTEIGGEVYVRAHGLIAMGSVTGGEIKGNVLQPQSRSPAFIGKLGVDRQVRPNLRVRLTGSTYTISKSPSNTLYSGDRAGSRYYYVLENTQATATANKDSGMIQPGFGYKVTAFQVNPFVKYGGLELFGVLEHAKGRGATEVVERSVNQYAVDVVYRFASNKLFAGARYNRFSGRLNIPADVTVNRTQLGAGWFITRNVLMKGEYVNQEYLGFPGTDIRNGGKFHGVMLEGVLSF